jgi:hypothetical protein
MIPPSILVHGLGGAILIFIFFFIIVYFQKLQNLDVYRSVVLLSLLSIVITVHGISHIGLEMNYDYIPFYSWMVKQKLNNRCPIMHNCPMKNID